MESTETEVRTIHITHVRVEEVKPSNAIEWWIHFNGSRESIQFLGDKPFEVGDMVKITFERVPNAKP